MRRVDHLCLQSQGVGADGRPILLRLSAGYDSWLVALMLSRLGCDNVHYYTRYHSSKDSEEFSTVERLTADLDFPHTSTYHDHSDYQKFGESDEWDKFYQTVKSMSNLTYPSAYVTLKKLREHPDVPDDALLLTAITLTDQFFYIFRYILMGLHYERYLEPLAVLKRDLLGVFGLSLAYVGSDMPEFLLGLHSHP